MIESLFFKLNNWSSIFTDEIFHMLICLYTLNNETKLDLFWTLVWTAPLAVLSIFYRHRAPFLIEETEVIKWNAFSICSITDFIDIFRKQYLYRMKYVLYFSSEFCIYRFFIDIFRRNLKIILTSIFVTGVQSIYMSCSLFMEWYVY